jgi:hypothetical protein
VTFELYFVYVRGWHPYILFFVFVNIGSLAYSSWMQNRHFTGDEGFATYAGQEAAGTNAPADPGVPSKSSQL